MKYAMIQIQKLTKPDIIGATASGLCILHCTATPFLFIVGAYSATSVHAPTWWEYIHYLFLVISFVAIRSSTKASTKSWVGYVLFIVWALLFLAVLNETLEMVRLPELVVYIPAFGLIGLHLYNQKYCKCGDSECCTN